MQTFQAERARRNLRAGVLFFRWGSLAWLIFLAATGDEPFARPVIAWGSVAVILAWTVWLTRSRREDLPVLSADLLISSGLFLISGIVVPAGQILDPRPIFATVYPWTTALAWGVAFGLRGGTLAGAVLSIAYLASRPINGIPLDALSPGQLQAHGTATVVFLLTGGVSGLISGLFERSAREIHETAEEAIRQRELAARLAEREVLAREVHDSVLQMLVLLRKQARELGERGSVRREDVLGLAGEIGKGERSVRSLILGGKEEPPEGRMSLREALEEIAREVSEVPVTVTTVGPVWLSADHVQEICAAVRQALANVVRHANAHAAFVYVEQDAEGVLISIRDDGRGFVYDEQQLAADGSVGLLHSIKGRIEDLGGTVRITTSPGAGTEVECRVPGEVVR